MPSDYGTIDTSPPRRLLSLHFIDADGQIRTDSYEILPAATDAQLNAFAGAIGAASNASLYKVSVTNEFATDIPSIANAVDAVHVSVKDNIVMLFKTITGATLDVFIPAPDAPLLVEGTTNPDPENVLIVAAVAAVPPAAGGGYQVASYRYSERRKKNRAVKA